MVMKIIKNKHKCNKLKTSEMVASWYEGHLNTSEVGSGLKEGKIKMKTTK